MNAGTPQKLESTRLMTKAGVLGWIVPVGLVLVLGSNIIALFLPFLYIDVAFKGHQEYMLPESVKLMWEIKLYWVAILIVAFSIIFPLLKTFSLIIIWFLRIEPRRRSGFIKLLETLGKWSMLDIFVVILLMVLSNDQIFITTTPRIGLQFFIFAIIGNMIMSRIFEMIDTRLHPEIRELRDEETIVLPLESTGGLGWAVPLFLVIGFVSLVIAVDVPFLRINDILLHSNSYSVLQATEALWERGNFVLSVFLVLFVAIMPALRILLIGVMWFSRRTKAHHEKRLELVRIIGEWSMMSVFLLALVMILTEGSEMIKTQIRTGLIAIVVSNVACLACIWISRRLLHKHLRTIPAPSS